MTKNSLYYGDNLPVLRKYIKEESVDLAYIDPPFNSKRNYNQIYNSIGAEDQAQAQAFIDTWTWDTDAAQGFEQILSNQGGRFPSQLVELIKGLRTVLYEGSLFAYLISMSLRVVEIHRVLKSTGSFYLHCDPTSSHYLKIILDSIFGSGNFRNEVIWDYSFRMMDLPNFFNRKHDVLLFYAKTPESVFHMPKTLWTKEDIIRTRKQEIHKDANGVEWIWMPGGKGNSKNKLKKISDIIAAGKAISDVWQIPVISSSSKERRGYPTQKPEALLDRIIGASSNEGDTVLDAYCGCGTTVAVSQRLNRKWIGIDITYQSISLMLKRFKDTFGEEVLSTITLDGIPKDMASATALAHKQDDRIRKEFEKWAVLTYSEDRATINQKKGADGGIDGTAHFMTSKEDNEKIIFQVKSGNVGLKDIRDLRGTIEQAHAPLGILITLQEPTQAMTRAAHAMGLYSHPLMQRDYDKIQIVTIKEMLEKGVRLTMPLTREVVKLAVAQPTSRQLQQLELLN